MAVGGEAEQLVLVWRRLLGRVFAKGGRAGGGPDGQNNRPDRRSVGRSVRSTSHSICGRVSPFAMESHAPDLDQHAQVVVEIPGPFRHRS